MNKKESLLNVPGVILIIAGIFFYFYQIGYDYMRDENSSSSFFVVVLAVLGTYLV